MVLTSGSNICDADAGRGNDMNKTPKCAKVMKDAREVCLKEGHRQVTPLHLLAALLSSHSIASIELERRGLNTSLTLSWLRKHFERESTTLDPEALPFEGNAEASLIWAEREAEALHHTFVGCEHLLLGLLMEKDKTLMTFLKGMKGTNNEVARSLRKALKPQK